MLCRRGFELLILLSPFPKCWDYKCVPPRLAFFISSGVFLHFSFKFSPFLSPPSLSAQRPFSCLCSFFSVSHPGSITVPKAATSAAQFSYHGQHSIPAHLEAIWSSAVPTWPFCCVPMFLAPVPCESSLEDRLVFCLQPWVLFRPWETGEALRHPGVCCDCPFLPPHRLGGLSIPAGV